MVKISRSPRKRSDNFDEVTCIAPRIVKVEETKATVEIEPEILDAAKVMSQFFLERYAASSEDQHYRASEEGNILFGLMAELIFDSVLYQYDVPHVWNNPSYQKLLGKKRFDFFVPDLGCCQIKGIPPSDRYCRLLVKEKEWLKERADWIIPVKVLEDRRALLYGAMPGTDVEKLQFAEKGKRAWSRYESCWFTSLTEYASKYSASALIAQLERIAAACRRCQKDAKEV